MTIHSALKHRAEVRRSVRTFEQGRAVNAWVAVAANLPCLLDALKADEGEQHESEKADRKGVLLTLPSASLMPGDRVRITRGSAGTFVVSGEPDERPTFHGISHREYTVTEVPSGG